MSDTVYTFGIDEMRAKLIDLRKNFIASEEREQELYKLGTIAQKEIVKETPVDSGKLRSSITVEVNNAERKALVGTNLDYGPAVEDGHMQNEHFLPSEDLDSVKGRKYLGANKDGIMLTGKFIQGAHMFQKGMAAAKPKLDAEINRWLEGLAIRFNG